LSTGVVWLGILLLIFTSLLPDIVFMLIGRQFYPSETQNMQAATSAFQREFHGTIYTDIESPFDTELSIESDVSMVDFSE